MILKDHVMPLFLEACPSFRRVWADHVASSGYEAGLLYVDLGQLAHHLVELVRSGATTELPAICDVIERMHTHGDAEIKEAATIGLLESIQNVAGHAGTSLAELARHLGPESARWWTELGRFWDGESPFVGAGLKPDK